MRSNVEKKIKRRNGEEYARVLRNHGVFDVPDIDQIVRYAGRGKDDAEKICHYLFSLKGIEIKDNYKENPFDLLKKAGYDAFLADTNKKKNSIRKYFAPGEEICTFTDGSRHKNYYIIHAIKEGAGNLLRKDFSNPRREDDYGVSVISIQIAKKGGFISIKNRYNHKVPNCDNTFGSNPDNIIQGLSSSLKNHLNVDFSSSGILPDGFILVGKSICKIEQEINGINFGFDFYVKNGEINEVCAGDGQYLIESYLYDDRAKKMTKLTSDAYGDSFPDDFNRYYGGRGSLNWRGKSLYDGELELLRCA